MAASRPNNGGFTLIEVLIAMSLFAIAATMVVPTMFAWVQANQLSLQRDRARQALDRIGDEYLQADWESGAWTTAHTASSYDAAVNTVLPGLSDSAYSDHGSVSLADTGRSADVDYAVVAVIDAQNRQVSRIMRLRAQWPGPAGNTRSEDRLLQRNVP